MGLEVEGVGAVDDYCARWNGVVVPESVGREITAELSRLLSAGSMQT